MYIHRSHTDKNLLTSLKTTERHSTLQSTLSQHQSDRAWRCRGVSGSLATGTCDVSPAASRRFPMVLGDTAVQHVPGFLPWMLFGQPTMLAQCVDLYVRMYYAAVQNLVYGCGNVPQTTRMKRHTTDTLCPTCAAIHPTSSRPTIRPCSNG